MEKPKNVTSSYEEGAFRYFDYHFDYDSNGSLSAGGLAMAADKDLSQQSSLELSSSPSAGVAGIGGSDSESPTGGWCQRIKHNFRFEYKFLA